MSQCGEALVVLDGTSFKPGNPSNGVPLLWVDSKQSAVSDAGASPVRVLRLSAR
ncbi:hypothetical protein [Dendronalium phyllosphericum]|uniref:hypothetical protein n=1 Tax=Dendronalium phyllosphericum TaxID=2840445 RepID=UPI001CEC7789|nr:hypothetical protein [Dendronalium phyllosphericum]